jgi:hypothetical protein
VKLFYHWFEFKRGLLLCGQTKALRFFIGWLFVFCAQINEEFALFATLIADLNDLLITGAAMR